MAPAIFVRETVEPIGVGMESDTWWGAERLGKGIFPVCAKSTHSFRAQQFSAPSHRFASDSPSSFFDATVGGGRRIFSVAFCFYHFSGMYGYTLRLWLADWLLVVANRFQHSLAVSPFATVRLNRQHSETFQQK